MHKTYKTNHGYVGLVYYVDPQTSPRVFGPYVTPAKAIQALRDDLELKISCDRFDRPIISRKYYVAPIPSAKLHERIAYVTIETLEDVRLFSKG